MARFAWSMRRPLRVGVVVRTVADSGRQFSVPMRIVATHDCAAHEFGKGLQHKPALELQGPHGEIVHAYADEVVPAVRRSD